MSVTDAPTNYNGDLTSKIPIISVTLPTGTLTKKGTNFGLFDSCKIWLLGASSKTVAPYTDINTWLSTANTQSLMNAHVLQST